MTGGRRRRRESRRASRRGLERFDPRWVVAALTRICRHLGLPLPEEADEHSEWMLAEVLGRYHEGRSFDLYDTPLAGPLVDDEPATARH